MLALTLLLAMTTPLIALAPAASAESGPCTIVESWPAPVEVTEPMTCGFPCDVGKGWITMRMEVTGGTIEASYGGDGRAGFHRGDVPFWFASGPVPGVYACAGAAGKDFQYADTGVCTFFPADDGPTFVYTAGGEASLR